MIMYVRRLLPGARISVWKSSMCAIFFAMRWIRSLRWRQWRKRTMCHKWTWVQFLKSELNFKLNKTYQIYFDTANESVANQYWLTHAPNYFFPKIDHYPDLKTAALVFLASAMSLIMLIFLLIIILYRMNHHVREQRELQSQLRTISELLGESLKSVANFSHSLDSPNLFISTILIIR